MSQNQLPKDEVVTLAETMQYTLAHAIRVAADKFAENAALVKASHQRMAEQFERQAEEARELAARIENAEYVKLGKEGSD